ncbi:MAG: hypothetical protein HY606_01770 [Planctomycetes bacterium]|nr:hypothetical protein [Planctomycetota bacterium]
MNRTGNDYLADFVSLKEITGIVKQVNELWKKEDYSIGLFGKIAYDVLKKSELHKEKLIENVLKKTAQAKLLPPQLSMERNFGYPPITLYAGDKFIIDIYFWVDPHTAVHNHSFTGAWVLLQGASLHNKFTFKAGSTYGGISTGKLSLESSELIKNGDINIIKPDSELIHQVWHLSCPSVSLVIRTAINSKLRIYFPNLEVLSPEYLSKTTIKKVHLMQFLAESAHPLEKSFIANSLKNSDDFNSFWLLHKYFGFTKNISKIHEIIKLSGQNYPWQADLIELFQSSHQVNLDLRSIRDEGARLFCALLFSTLDTEQIVKIIKEYAPDRSPLETATNWIGRLEKSGLISFSQNKNIAPVLKFLHEAGKLGLHQTTQSAAVN